MQDVLKINRDDLRKGLECVGKDGAIICRESLLTDYQFAQSIEHYLFKETDLGSCRCRVKSPYIIISGLFFYQDRTQQLAQAINVPAEIITAIDYPFGYEYIVNCQDLISSSHENRISWSNIDFLESMMEMGEYGNTDCIDVDSVVNIVRNSLYDEEDDLMVAVEIENNVLAIAVDKYIPDAKETFSNILGIDSELFIEVSGPISTVILIDAEKIYLMSETYDIEVEKWLI